MCKLLITKSLHMKKFYLISTLLVFLTGSLFSNHRYDFLEGKYFNTTYDVDIKVKSTRNGIKVKGLPGRRGYVHFNERRRGIFLEKQGPSIISFYGRNEVEFKRSRRSRSISFYRNGYNRHNYGTHDYNYYRNENRRQPSDLRRQRRNVVPRNNPEFDSGNNLQIESIVGEWYSNELRKLVIIERDGQGIRARLSGDKKWTEYMPSSQGTFTDKRGNIYRLNSSDQLIWKDSNGNNSYTLFRS